MGKKLTMPVPAGAKVRFTMDSLGASRRDDLGHVVAETFGIGDEGQAAFIHPHKMCAATGWFYVEVVSKVNGEKLYVGVRSGMWEEATPTEGQCPATIPGAFEGTAHRCRLQAGHAGRCWAGGDVYFAKEAR
jgi:hypothetical protein